MLDEEEAAMRPECAVALRHSSWVTSLSIRGSLLATAANNGVATLWRLPDGEQLLSLPHDEPINALRLSGEFLVCGCQKGTVAVWSVPHGQQVKKMRHADSVGAVAIDDVQEFGEGALLATGSDDLTAAVWRLPACERIAQVRREASIGTVALGGGYLVTGCDDGDVSVWALPLCTDALLQIAAPNCGRWVCSMALHSGVLACASAQRTVSAWSLPSGEMLFDLSFEDMVLSVALHGQLLACGSRDGSTTLWRLPSGQRVLGFKHDLAEEVVTGSEGRGTVPIYAVALEDGLLACAPQDCSAVVWKVGEEDLLLRSNIAVA